MKLIKDLVNRLHAHCVHGDLKPSNIGVDLDQEGKIITGYILDCQKVSLIQDHDKKTLEALINKDWNNFIRHYEQNIATRKT